MSSRWANPVNNNILRDLEGTVLASGSVEFFAANTSTPINVYSDAALSSSLGSYIDADPFGLLPDFHLAAGTQVKVQAYDAIGGSAGAGALKWTRDYTFSLDSSTDTRLDALETSVAAIQAGYGNAIINGGMRVASETGSATLTTSYLEGGVAQHYGKVANVTAGTLVQTADADYSTGYVLHFSGVSTSDAAATVDGQIRIDSKDSQRFVDQAAIFSCSVEHDVGSAVDYTITVSKADAQDDFSAITTIQASASATSVASGTITAISLAVTDMGDCSNGIAITISAACGIVTTKNFKIGVAQFEKGSAATGFSELPFLVEDAAIYGRGLYYLGEYSFSSGAVDFVDICSGGDLDVDLSKFDYVIVEGQFGFSSGGPSVGAVEIGTVSGGIEDTAIYQYLAKYVAPSGTTESITDQNSSLTKAANLYYTTGDTTAGYRFRLVVKKPIAGFSPAYVELASKCVFIDAATANAGTQTMEGYVNGVSDFDWVRIYCTTIAASQNSAQNFSDGVFRAYGTNNLGFATV